MDHAPDQIRVALVQPSLAKYRVPVFREFAARPGIDLHVIYGALKGLQNVTPEGFRATPTPYHEWKLAGVRTMFHGAEWTACGGRDADVVITRWSPRDLTLPAALLRAKRRGVPTVLWGHGYSKDDRGPRYGQRRRLARLADALVFYEPRTRQVYIDAGWDPDRLFVALNSLDTTPMQAAQDYWRAEPGRLEGFRREHGLGGGPVVLFVSRLQPKNRVDLLVRATAQLVQQTPGLKTVVIGSGDEERSRLKQLASDLGVAGAVMFHDGIYDEQQLAPWLLTADVFCYPENIGLSLIHAFAYGLPVVTSDCEAGQNPEIVALEDGVNGALYRHGSVEALAEAIGRIVSDDQLRAQMETQAIQTIAQRFNITRMVDGLEAAVRYAYDSKQSRQKQR